MVDCKKDVDGKTGKLKNGKCPYPVCVLKTEKDGTKCFIKAVCFVVAYMNLGKDYSLFTGITIFLFLFPTTIDLAFLNVRTFIIKTIKYLIVFSNIIILLICFSTTFGYTFETLYGFTVVPNAIIFSGKTFSKHTLFCTMLIVNFFALVINYFASPILESSLIVKFTSMLRRRERKEKFT